MSLAVAARVRDAVETMRARRCADIAGNGNLVVVNGGNNAHLVFLDIGVFELGGNVKDNPRGCAETRRASPLPGAATRSSRPARRRNPVVVPGRRMRRS